jgi:hypothetical protein
LVVVACRRLRRHSRRRRRRPLCHCFLSAALGRQTKRFVRVGRVTETPLLRLLAQVHAACAALRYSALQYLTYRCHHPSHLGSAPHALQALRHSPSDFTASFVRRRVSVPPLARPLQDPRSPCRRIR